MASLAQHIYFYNDLMFLKSTQTLNKEVIYCKCSCVSMNDSHKCSSSLYVRCYRFTLYQRRACPPTLQPYQQSCTTGDPNIVYEGMYIEKVIHGLAPYTAYEFQIQSVNDAGPIDFPIWIRVETKSDGTKLILDFFFTIIRF